MKLAILTFMLVSGCSSPHWEWEAAILLCKDHGGAYEVGSFGAVHCVDGKWFSPQRREEVTKQIIEKSP